MKGQACRCGIIFLAFFISSCASIQPYYKFESGLSSHFDPENIDYEIYMLSDIGSVTNTSQTETLMHGIRDMMADHSTNQAVIFLGDFLPVNGLPDEETEAFRNLEKTLKSYLDLLMQQTENIYFIPGNNEWYDGKNYTLDNLRSSEEFLEGLAQEKDIFMPSSGCGEPVVLELSDALTLVLSDSQWLVQSDDSNERQKSGCDIDDNLEYVKYIQGILSSHKNKNIVLASHHPLYSNGQVGGNYPLSNHLLPLPVVGSLVTGVKKIMGRPQQFGHPDYEAYRASFSTGLQNCEGCLVVSGHENNLQYFDKGDNHFAVVGSGSPVEYVRQADGANFSVMRRGFAKVIQTKDFELWLEMYGIQPGSNKVEILYRKLIHKKDYLTEEFVHSYKSKNEISATKKVIASDFYGKKKFLRGQFYRDAWSQEIDAPLLWLDNVHGGLKPIQQGGGFQTRSLRLENADGVQYVIRSIDKDLEKFVPPALRQTFAKNVIQDAIAAAHPYGAIVIPKLAHAAGIYHTNPICVYLPAQEALDIYNDEFADGLYIFEERPGGNVTVHDDFGNPKRTINTLKLVELLEKNHKHQVDQKFVLRNRLFDLWIGDWDRHDDQWRWAVFDQEDYSLYRPIPRDRDQVFYKNDGVLDYIASRPYFNTDLRKFDENIDFLPGLMSSGKNFDRSFLHELSYDDFIEVAKDLQARLTDDVIDIALKDWPIEIQVLNASEIKQKLVARRANLQASAAEFYSFLYKEVAISATQSRDIFELEFLPDNRLQVSVFYKIHDDRHQIYQNILDGRTTKEVRLYGLKKDDQFNISGDHKSSIRMRIVGGSGEDLVVNESINKKIFVYDRPDGMEVSGSFKSRIKDQDGVNSYNRTDRQINRFIHFPMPSFYIDEGFGLSYNIWWKRFGFRSDPYKSNHTLGLSYFPQNRALSLKYRGIHPDAFGLKNDFELIFNALGPAFTQYYYGLGNNYINFGEAFPAVDDALSPRFHIVKGTHIDLKPSYILRFRHSASFRITPLFEFFQIETEDEDPRFYLSEMAGITPQEFEESYYAGLALAYQVSRMDNTTVPTRGFNFILGVHFKQDFTNTDFSHFRLGSELQTYIPFNQSKTVVLSMNIGGAYNFGETKFYHANYLSNKSRLRGFRTNRFGGEGILYHATDLRIGVIKGKGTFPISMGVFGSFDYGRAWYKNQKTSESKLHSSFGGGVFLIPLDAIGFKFGYFIGEDDRQILIGGSLLF